MKIEIKLVPEVALVSSISAALIIAIASLIARLALLLSLSSTEDIVFIGDPLLSIPVLIGICGVLYAEVISTIGESVFFVRLNKGDVLVNASGFGASLEIGHDHWVSRGDPEIRARYRIRS